MNVAVLVPRPEASEYTLPQADANMIFTIVAVDKASAVADVSRAIASKKYCGFINLCNGSPMSATVPGAEVAELLHSSGAKYTGVSPKYLSFTRGDIAMMGFYSDSEIFVANHAVVTQANVSSASDNLTFPLVVASNTNQIEGLRVAENDAELQEALKLILENESTAFVSEAPPTEGSHISCLVAESALADAPLTVALAPEDKTNLEDSLHEEVFRRVRGLFKDMFGEFGYATFRLVVKRDEKAHNGVWIRLLEAHPNEGLLRSVFTNALFQSSEDLQQWVKAAVSKQRERIPAFSVTYDAKLRGYFVRAAHDIKKGELVFDDEAQPQTIVTKPHVQRNWKEEDRETFSRYAWPLDSNGHTYAMWHDHPRKWRPINHSCDPTVIFAEGHSLNGVAARDLKKGDDLTLDYAAFCDFTMKPFKCFCGAACCRGVVQPSAEALAKYGSNAWHRQMPVQEETLSTKKQ